MSQEQDGNPESREGQDEGGGELRYHHSFTDEELDMMLYEWDNMADPVTEYHYMKKEWETPDALIGGKGSKESLPPKPKKENKPLPDLRKDAKDTGTRTVVDLNKDAPKDEVPVFLNIDTAGTAVVVEFYTPWCPHCRRLKNHYIAVAQEATRRAIGSPVEFYAVSCQLYREICRAYEIKGFPVVLGYPLESNIEKVGFELNRDGVTMTADLIGAYLGLTLAEESKDLTLKNFTNATQRAMFEAHQTNRSTEAARIKHEWQTYPSSINERFHNAATSFAFVLKSSIYMGRTDVLPDSRALALKEFLELTDWALPQSWHVRTQLVQELLNNLVSVIQDGPRVLIDTVERHQGQHFSNGLWGDLHLKMDTGVAKGLGVDAPRRSGPPRDPDAAFWKNIKWTESCTHAERGMGFTCGLWDLLHILSIGTSIPIHRVYGFRSGYLTAPTEVAEIMKRFVGNFFACDVCRWNFLNMYDNCGHDWCNRLNNAMPELSGQNPTQVGRELAIWLWEVHNSVNVRLMREAATAEDRTVTQSEKLASIFPPPELCPNCWEDDTLTSYDKDEVFAFLKRWYWPRIEVSNRQFQSTVRRRLTRVHQIQTKLDTWWFIVGPVGLLLAAMIRRLLHQAAEKQRKSV